MTQNKSLIDTELDLLIALAHKTFWTPENLNGCEIDSVDSWAAFPKTYDITGVFSPGPDGMCCCRAYNKLMFFLITFYSFSRWFSSKEMFSEFVLLSETVRIISLKSKSQSGLLTEISSKAKTRSPHDLSTNRTCCWRWSMFNDKLEKSVMLE